MTGLVFSVHEPYSPRQAQLVFDKPTMEQVVLVYVVPGSRSREAWPDISLTEQPSRLKPLTLPHSPLWERAAEKMAFIAKKEAGSGYDCSWSDD